MSDTTRRPRRAITGSLRTQLMLVTVAPVTILLLVVALVGVFSVTRMTQTMVEQRDSELVQLATQQVSSYWADSVLLLTQIASTDVIRMGNETAIQALLHANVALSQRFDQVCITNAQGVIIATVGGRKGDNIGQLSFFERTRRLRRPVRSPIFQDADGNRVIAVAVPIYDLTGQFAGCALGIWDLNGARLGLPIANLRVGQSGFAYLVDEYGTILYHPAAELVGADSSQHPAVAALLRGQIGAQTVSDSGRRMVVGYAPLSLRKLTSSLFADESWDGWGLLTAEMWDDIVAPLSTSIRLMTLLLLLVIVLPLTILALISQRIAAPLQSLVTQVERIASGEFDSQIAIYSGPLEVRELEVAFNAMVDQLRKYRNDIQNYIVSILNSQEEERKRIARELHDETAQALIVLGRRIELAEELAIRPELKDELEGLRDMVDDTLQGVRRFTSDLRPPLLEELGLPRTLEILGDRIAREESLNIETIITGTPRQLLPEFELGLYRLAQECLSNVRRHARASGAEIRLTYAPNLVMLEISDDGIGFEVPDDPGELVKMGGLGLMGIYERARLFGGKAKIESLPGKGTHVTITIPITAIVLPQAASKEQARRDK